MRSVSTKPDREDARGVRINVRLMPDGKMSREVEAEMVGRFLAVHQWIGPGETYWVVTHILTGFRVGMGKCGRWKTRADALAFAGDIADADWNHSTPKDVVAAVQEIVLAAMRKPGRRTAHW